MEYVEIKSIRFKNRRHINWEDVAIYMKQFQGDIVCVNETSDRIHINFDSVHEYSGSKYTMCLKGGLAKVKANAVQIIPQLIQSATNKRWIENKAEKHNNTAKRGWYRFDVYFMYPKSLPNGEIEKKPYRGTLVVKSNDRGLFFYDLVDIKKEAGNSR